MNAFQKGRAAACGWLGQSGTQGRAAACGWPGRRDRHRDALRRSASGRPTFCGIERAYSGVYDHFTEDRSIFCHHRHHHDATLCCPLRSHEGLLPTPPPGSTVKRLTVTRGIIFTTRFAGVSGENIEDNNSAPPSGKGLREFRIRYSASEIPATFSYSLPNPLCLRGKSPDLVT